jgi:hypothetical protein
VKSIRWMLGAALAVAAAAPGAHDGRNVGNAKAVMLATYVVATGKPVASPAK